MGCDCAALPIASGSQFGWDGLGRCWAEPERDRCVEKAIAYTIKSLRLLPGGGRSTSTTGRSLGISGPPPAVAFHLTTYHAGRWRWPCPTFAVSERVTWSRVVTSPFTCFNGAVEETSRLIATLPSTRHPTYVPNRGNEPIATVAKSPLFGWAANLGFSLKTKFGQKSAQPDRTFGRLGNTKGGTASGHQGFRTYRFCGAGADRSGPCFGGAIFLWASFASLPSAAWRPA